MWEIIKGKNSLLFISFLLVAIFLSSCAKEKKPITGPAQAISNKLISGNMYKDSDKKYSFPLPSYLWTSQENFYFDVLFHRAESSGLMIVDSYKKRSKKYNFSDVAKRLAKRLGGKVEHLEKTDLLINEGIKSAETPLEEIAEVGKVVEVKLKIRMSRGYGFCIERGGFLYAFRKGKRIYIAFYMASEKDFQDGLSDFVRITKEFKTL